MSDRVGTKVRIIVPQKKLARINIPGSVMSVAPNCAKPPLTGKILEVEYIQTTGRGRKVIASGWAFPYNRFKDYVEFVDNE